MVKKRSKCFFCLKMTTNMKKHIQKKCNKFVQISNDIFSIKIMPQIRYNQMVILLNKKMKSFMNLFHSYRIRYDLNIFDDMEIVSLIQTNVINYTEHKKDYIFDKYDFIYPVFKRKRYSSIVCINNNMWSFFDFSYIKMDCDYYKEKSIYISLEKIGWFGNEKSKNNTSLVKYLSMFDDMEKYWEINNILLMLDNIKKIMNK